MSLSKPIVKRRKWKRFKIRGSAIVMIHKPRFIEFGKPTLIELGPLIDISLGGLAVQYVETKKRLVDSAELSISFPNKGVSLGQMPFKIVSNSTIATLPDSKKIINRCVEFEKLTPYQSFQLESFINKFSIKTFSDRRSTEDRRQYFDPKFDDIEYKTLYDRRIQNERRTA
jgi:hypothetical protein